MSVNLVKALKDYSLEVGQFLVTKHNIGTTLSEEGFEVLSSRVLHFRADNKLAERLYPYKGLEKISWLNFLSIMFLIVARIRRERVRGHAAAPRRYRAKSWAAGARDSLGAKK